MEPLRPFDAATIETFMKPAWLRGNISHVGTVTMHGGLRLLDDTYGYIEGAYDDTQG